MLGYRVFALAHHSSLLLSLPAGFSKKPGCKASDILRTEAYCETYAAGTKDEETQQTGIFQKPAYSHSIVLGGLVLISYTTRFTPLTSLTIRLEIRSRTS